MSIAIALAGLVVSLIALVISTVFARGQAAMARAQARIADAQPLAIDLFREFRQRSGDRRRLHHELRPEESSEGLESIKDEDLQQIARSTSHWYDNVGVLVAHGLVEPEYVVGFLGDSVRETWELLEPFIVSERVRRGFADYQDYFEYLALRVKTDLQPEVVRRRVMPELYEARLKGSASA